MRHEPNDQFSPPPNAFEIYRKRRTAPDPNQLANSFHHPGYMPSVLMTQNGGVVLFAIGYTNGYSAHPLCVYTSQGDLVDFTTRRNVSRSSGKFRYKLEPWAPLRESADVGALCRKWVHEVIDGLPPLQNYKWLS